MYDVAIVGAGPVGMVAAYYAGTRGLKPILIDTMAELGGQCAALYPEKMIYDVASQPGCTGSELVSYLESQLNNVSYDLTLDTRISGLYRTDSDDDDAPLWELTTRQGERSIRTRTVILAIGKGAFKPRKLGVIGEDLLGVHYTVRQLDIFDGQRVLIVGGGDSAMDWSLALKDRAAEITQIHRRSQYRAQAATVEQVRQAAEAGKLTMLTNYELAELVGEGDKIREAVIFDNRSQARKTIPVDKVLLSTGMLPDLGDINEWGLDIEDGKIAVDPYRGYATNLPGIFAIGDVAHFAGKVELIITGFGEAATAAYYAYEHIHGKIKGAAWCAKLPT